MPSLLVRMIQISNGGCGGGKVMKYFLDEIELDSRSVYNFGTKSGSAIKWEAETGIESVD